MPCADVFFFPSSMGNHQGRLVQSLLFGHVPRPLGCRNLGILALELSSDSLVGYPEYPCTSTPDLDDCLRPSRRSFFQTLVAQSPRISCRRTTKTHFTSCRFRFHVSCRCKYGGLPWHAYCLWGNVLVLGLIVTGHITAYCRTGKVGQL